MDEVVLGGESFSVSERKAGVFIPSISKNYGHTWAGGNGSITDCPFCQQSQQEMYEENKKCIKKKKGICPPDKKAAFGDLPLLVTFMWSIKFR